MVLVGLVVLWAGQVFCLGGCGGVGGGFWGAVRVMLLPSFRVGL